MSLPDSPSLDLSGQRALVTGASSGIGLGCAVALARAGASVTCVARRAGPLAEVVEQMRAEGLDAHAQVADITRTEDQEALFTEPHDILCNAAGLARHGSAFDTTEADFDAVMGVNLRAAYFLSVRAARALRSAGKRGSLIHISSQMGHVGGPERAVYCASKHAVEGMTKALALEFGPLGIRINTVCPTFIRTPLTEPTFADPAKRAWLERNIALDRVGEVSDIMGAVVYLASPASALVTGTALKIDGGWTAA